MKSNILIFLILSCGFNLVAQSNKSISDRKIKSVYSRTEDSRKGQLNVKINYTRYDKQGNIIEEIEYNGDSVITKWEQYFFNKQNKETLYQQIDSTKKILKKVTTAYDKWGNNIEQIEYGINGIVNEKTVSSYNNFNDKMKEVTFDKDGKIVKSTEYEYDKKGMLLFRRIFSGDGKLIYSRQYNYGY